MKAFDSGKHDSGRNFRMKSFALKGDREIFSRQKASLK